MKEIVITKPSTVGALGVVGGFVQFESNDGPYQIRFAAEEAAKIAESFSLAAHQIVKERQRLGMTPIQEILIKKIAALEFAADHLKHVAVLRTRFVDGTTQDTPVAQDQIPALIEFLSRTLQNFEDQSSMPRQ